MRCSRSDEDMNHAGLMKLSCRRVLAGCWAIVGIAAIGCGESGPATAHLSGTVTINGQALPPDTTGDIVFSPVDKASGSAATVPIENGRYDSPKTPMGAVKVFFNINQATGPEIINERGNKTRATKSLVPAGASTGIDVQVAGDNDAQNFNLE
jgi:hypothetical protein